MDCAPPYALVVNRLLNMRVWRPAVQLEVQASPTAFFILPNTIADSSLARLAPWART
jgi:hypothetical protein